MKNFKSTTFKTMGLVIKAIEIINLFASNDVVVSDEYNASDGPD